MAAKRISGWFGGEEAGGTSRGPAGAAGGGGPAAAGVLWAYTLAGGLAVGVSVLFGRNPFACDGWFGARGAAALFLSMGLGVCLGALTIGATRALVRTAEWARALHGALRPAVRSASDGTIWGLAIASAFGEELLFRGLLVPAIGVVASALVFGGLHQISGPGRWGWVAWATLMGLLFGGLFAATGSLAGPIVAHLVINRANLRFLRDNDPDPRPRHLGGLLRRGG